MVPEYRRKDVRERIYGDFRIVYLLRADTMIVSAVHRCSKPLPEDLF